MPPSPVGCSIETASRSDARRPDAAAAAAGDGVLGGAVGAGDDRRVAVVDREPAAVVRPADRPDRRRRRDVLRRPAAGRASRSRPRGSCRPAELGARRDQRPPGAQAGRGGSARRRSAVMFLRPVPVEADDVDVAAAGAGDGAAERDPCAVGATSSGCVASKRDGVAPWAEPARTAIVKARAAMASVRMCTSLRPSCKTRSSRL